MPLAKVDPFMDVSQQGQNVRWRERESPLTRLHGLMFLPQCVSAVLCWSDDRRSHQRHSRGLYCDRDVFPRCFFVLTIEFLCEGKWPDIWPRDHIQRHSLQQKSRGQPIPVTTRFGSRIFRQGRCSRWFLCCFDTWVRDRAVTFSHRRSLIHRQVFLVKKADGPDAGTLYAMKVLKKATLKGRSTRVGQSGGDIAV